MEQADDGASAALVALTIKATAGAGTRAKSPSMPHRGNIRQGISLRDHSGDRQASYSVIVETRAMTFEPEGEDRVRAVKHVIHRSIRHSKWPGLHLAPRATP